MKPSETNPKVGSAEIARPASPGHGLHGTVSKQGTITLKGLEEYVILEAYLPGFDVAYGTAKLPAECSWNVKGLRLDVPVSLDSSGRLVLPTEGIDVAGFIVEAFKRVSLKNAEEVTVPPTPEQPPKYEHVFDLNAERPASGSRVFDGIARGQELRKKFNLDAVDQEEGQNLILIPEDTVAVSHSFFDGLFGKSVRNLEHNFNFKYKFECVPTLMPQITLGINYSGRLTF